MVRYVITITQNNKKYYLQYETPGTIDPKTHQTLKEPMGHFKDTIDEAMKIDDKQLALAISASYDYSKVEEVEE